MPNDRAPHRVYLFGMKNGKKKLAYGTSPDDAWEVLGYRLTPEEMTQVNRDDCTRISQRTVQQYVHELG